MNNSDNTNRIMEDSISAFFGFIAQKGEVECYLGDLFITYEEVVKMIPGKKAVIMTRKNGCEQIMSSTNSFAWSEKRGYYMVTRLEDEKGILGIDIPMVSFFQGTEDDAKTFLKASQDVSR